MILIPISPFGELLIVPYGIETPLKRDLFKSKTLLIVPYGIETNEVLSCCLHFRLLIVPYGIETNMKMF